MLGHILRGVAGHGYMATENRRNMHINQLLQSEAALASKIIQAENAGGAYGEASREIAPDSGPLESLFSGEWADGLTVESALQRIDVEGYDPHDQASDGAGERQLIVDILTDAFEAGYLSVFDLVEA